jgi:chromosome segregation ATPase
MASAFSQKLRGWSARVQNAEILLEVSKLELAYNDLPPKAKHIIDWILSLPSENSLFANGLSVGDYEALLQRSCTVSTSSIDEFDEPLTVRKEYVDWANEEVKRVGERISELEHKLSVLSEELEAVKSREKTISLAEAAFLEAVKRSHIEYIRKATEQEGMSAKLSSVILDGPPKSGRLLNRIKQTIHEVSEAEATLLRHVASSASQLSDIQQQLEQDTAATATAVANDLDASLSVSYLDYETERQRTAVKRLQDARTKLNQITYDARV